MNLIILPQIWRICCFLDIASDSTSVFILFANCPSHFFLKTSRLLFFPLHIGTRSFIAIAFGTQCSPHTHQHAGCACPAHTSPSPVLPPCTQLHPPETHSVLVFPQRYSQALSVLWTRLLLLPALRPRGLNLCALLLLHDDFLIVFNKFHEYLLCICQCPCLAWRTGLCGQGFGLLIFVPPPHGSPG